MHRLSDAHLHPSGPWPARREAALAECSASERAYRLLKSGILHGAISPGPLDIGELGDRLNMSATPVREALARLSSEQLVRLAPHHGYALVAPSARRLEHLYELAGALIDASLRRVSRSSPRPRAETGATDAPDYGESVTALLRDIARAQGNPELADQVVRVNERLFLVRGREPDVIASSTEELSNMQQAWASRSYPALRALLQHYHRLRIARVDALSRLLCGDAD